MALFSRRTRKQVTYAVGFLVVVVAVAAGALVVLRTPRNTMTLTPTITPQYSDIIQEAVVVLPYQGPAGQSLLDVVVQLRNPNARAGVTAYPVDLTVLSATGEELLKRREPTHVLPGALHYVVAVGLELPRGKVLGQVIVNRPAAADFQELPEEVPLPSFSTFLRERRSQPIGDTVIETQTGLVKNSGTFDWQKVEVVAVALNANREIVAAGTTFLGRLLAGEQREFTVQWPKPEESIAQVVILPSTDMFSEENIVEILGDPSQLR